MVRSGELANRLTALHFGADLVWSPEYIDKKIIKTVRQVSELGLVEYVLPYVPNNKSGTRAETVFRTIPSKERGRLIFQLGSSDPALAVEAALKVVEDVDGIDLNCGCPKPFSTHSGSGQALLSNPDVLCDILTSMVQKVGKVHNIPISCKIRWLDSYADTESLIGRICATGIANLTIHCRTRTMRNRENPEWQYLKRIIPFVQGKGVSVIVNGNLQSRQDFLNMQAALQNSQVGGMIAECAECNLLVFGPAAERPLFPTAVVPVFFGYAKSYNREFVAQTKFLLLNQVPGKSPFYQSIAKVKSFDGLEEAVSELASSQDKLVNKIFLKNCQKQRLYDADEYDEHIMNRYKSMEDWLSETKDNDRTVIAPMKRKHQPDNESAPKKTKVDQAS